MSNFLFEIGTEELPADFAALVITQLKECIVKDLNESKVTFKNVSCTSTPRRIVAFISELPEFAEDTIEIKKGPPLQNSFVDGIPTQAAKGFAKSINLSVDKLEVKEINKGSFLFGKIVMKGEKVEDILSRKIPSWINSLEGKRFMKWGESNIRFSRPIRWLITLLDKKLIKVTLEHCDPIIKSGRRSFGHRLNSNQIYIDNASEYFQKMKDSGIIVYRDERMREISNLVKDNSKKLGLKPDLNEKLLNELTDLVESPNLLECNFDKEFLKLPSEVLSTVMIKHQRYIPLYKKNAIDNKLVLSSENILDSKFLCVSNGLIQSKVSIKKGNEKVIKARFSDAQFFMDYDISNSCDNRNQKLNSITFANGIGSLGDRVNRISIISKYLAKIVDKDIDIKSLELSSKYCKNDLSSEIIKEFPELQGLMAAKYLLNQYGDIKSAIAVYEHYLPKFKGDILPTSIEGALLSISERIELLISIFIIGKRPSGSSDPYALRRAANGIIQIIIFHRLNINLVDLIINLLNNWNSLIDKFSLDKNVLANDLYDLLIQRSISYFEDNNYDQDIIKSVFYNNDINLSNLSDLLDSKLKIDLITILRRDSRLIEIQSIISRVSRLAEKGGLDISEISSYKLVDKSLFEKDSESKLLDIIDQIYPILISKENIRYSNIIDIIEKSSSAFCEFFDGANSVMVMTDDPKVRENRLNLLGLIRNQMLNIADFSKIII